MSSNSYPSPTPSTALLETAITIIILTLILLTWILRLTAPFPINYGEGPLLDQAVRLAHFKNIYQPIGDAPPWTVSNYPPLYQLLNVPFVWIFGPAFWYGRLISMLAALTSAYLIQQISVRLGAAKPAARFGAIIFLSSYPVVRWCALMRVDALALVLGLLAIYISLSPNRYLRTGITIAALLSLVTLTRWINLIFPAAAVFIILAKRTNLKFLTYTAVITLTLCLVTLGVIDFLSHGWFWFHIVVSNYNPWSAQRVLSVLSESARLSPALVILLAAVVISIFSHTLRLDRKLYLLVTISLCTAITIGKIGSDVNYLFDLCAVLGICCALLRDKCVQYLIRMTFVFSTGLLSTVVMLRVFASDYHQFTDPNLKSAREALMTAIQQHAGRVISDDMMGMEVLSGFPLLFQSFEMQMLANQGKWDEQNLLRAIVKKDITLAIVEADKSNRVFLERWSKPIRDYLNNCPHQKIHFAQHALVAYQLESCPIPNL